MPEIQISAFGEDFAHRSIVDPLIARIAALCGLDTTVDWRNARHGHGRVVAELGEYFRDLRGQGGSPQFGRGCQAPDQKCDRDRYKQALIRAIADAGVIPTLGGIEFAEDLVQAMDLERAARADVSFKRFLDDLRGALGAFGGRP
jgi:hypothetical protein